MENNPYLGPRPYERADRQHFYGRSRETRDLLALILSERAVLFYAPSGAGKTSLLNAQIIPALENEGFNVFPTARVGGDLPPTVDPATVSNSFVFNALMTLAGGETPPECLCGQTLSSFLLEHSETNVGEDFFMSSRPPLVIFDQFEELFTTHQEQGTAVRDFFQQVAAALEALPELGVVFVLHEDHVAALDPHTILFPNRLRARFRMERLDVDGAREAIRRPAEAAGCPFAPGVAEQLVDDLRQVKPQRPLGAAASWGTAEGSFLGPYVEPVHLQVVCHRLWESLPAQSGRVIQWEDIRRYGSLDRALTEFYEGVLEQVQRETQVSERRLRRWFGDQLITPLKTRSAVLHGPEETAGLPNTVVRALERHHLIRADVRAGGRWYELVHDRLVDPILQSNQEWDTVRQTPLRTAARQWSETHNSKLLYRDQALEEALAWATANPDDVEPYEQEFLETARRAEKSRARLQEKLNFIREVPIFQAMSTEELRSLASISRAATYPAGHRILTQGGRGNTMYIVVRGQVVIQRQANADEGLIVTLATFGPHECFAEMSLFDNEPYSADVVAVEPTEVLMIRREPLVALIKRHPEIALGLFKVFSQRLRLADDRLAQL